MGIDAAPVRVQHPAMASIGTCATLRVIRQVPFGMVLDGGELGGVLLPRREVPVTCALGDELEVFLYTDSEDRPVATLQRPRVMPGEFGKLQVVAVTPVGAFLDWGLPKDLLVPFREQKSPLEPGTWRVVHVRVDEASQRVIATTRLERHLDHTPPPWQPGDAVDLLVYAKTPMGYKAVVNHTHSGLLHRAEVFQPLRPGERLTGYIAAVRPDGKLDLNLHPPGRARVSGLEEQILAELTARGGFWAISDDTPAAEIHAELGVSKRTFKQATGALFRKRKILLSPTGIRLPSPPAE